MSNLARKRKEFDLKRVETARMELELKIEESLENIERLKNHIKVQDAKIAELEEELAEMPEDSA